MNIDLKSSLIYLARHGSHAYGLNTPESDLDTKGVLIPPVDYIHGLFVVEQVENSKDIPGNDSVVYEIRKFFRLAADCNPNIIEVLFCDDSDILISTKVGEKLRENRELFLSRKAKHTFSGYAFSQLKRIKAHKKWLLDPPKAKPCRSDFGLPEELKVINNEAFSSEVMTAAIVHEKQYAEALARWDQYQNWRNTRNPKRAELEAKFGFDCKNATHLIRLSRMCLEILSGKGVIVKRPDAEELLSIRKGAWTYDQVMEYAESSEKEAEKLYVTSTLPYKPDMGRLNKLCIELIEEHLMRGP